MAKKNKNNNKKSNLMKNIGGNIINAHGKEHVKKVDQGV